MGISWHRRPVRMLSGLALICLVFLQACGENNGNFSSSGNDGGVSTNQTITFTGSILFVKDGDLFILRGKDEHVTALTSSHTALQPSISPDGKYLTYIRRENGQDNLYIMPVPATITGTPNTLDSGVPEVYQLVDGSSTKYYTNTSYFTKSQKLAEGIIGQPVWGAQNQLFFIQFQNNEFNLFLANVKFSGSAPTVTLDGTPQQLTQNGIDGGSRPVWLSA